MQEQPDSQPLIELIYAALLAESSWEAFLNELRQILPNGKAVMFYHDAGSGSGAWQLTAGIDPEADAAYGAYYCKINPWMPGATTRPLGRSVVADAMLPRSDLITSEFYNDYLRPQHVQTGIGVTLRRDGACNFLLSVISADVEETRAKQAAACLQALVPHLQRAFEFYQRNERCAFGVFSGSAIGESPRVGVIRIGHGRKVREANAVAQAMAESSGSFRIDCAGRFRCVDSHVINFIESALSAWPRRRDGLCARTFLISRADGVLPLRITVLAPLQRCEEAFFMGPECILLVEEPQLELCPAVEEFGTFYRLTSAEKRVLLGLANGLTLEQLAAESGIAASTARVHLRQIFAKTSVHRQSDLVRLVCGLAASSFAVLYSAETRGGGEQRPAKHAEARPALEILPVSDQKSG